MAARSPGAPCAAAVRLLPAACCLLPAACCLLPARPHKSLRFAPAPVPASCPCRRPAPSRHRRSHVKATGVAALFELYAFALTQQQRRDACSYRAAVESPMAPPPLADAALEPDGGAPQDDA